MSFNSILLTHVNRNISEHKFERVCVYDTPASTTPDKEQSPNGLASPLGKVGLLYDTYFNRGGGWVDANTYVVNPDSYLLEVRGSYCRVRIFKGTKGQKLGGGIRGEIQEFSKQSARRLRYFIFSLDSPPKLFITLTYPEDYPPVIRTKIHLDKFFTYLKRWLIRRKIKYSAIWKLEFQKRGAPHYHILMYTDYEFTYSELTLLRNFISHIWYFVVGSGDEKHLKAGTQVKVVKSKRELVSYVTKYVAKPEQGNGEKTGRFWGVRCRENLPIAQSQLVYLNRSEYIALRRLVKRWLKRFGSRSRSYARYIVKKARGFGIIIDCSFLQSLLRFVTGQPIELEGYGWENAFSPTNPAPD